ncbi:L-2-hydroxyglutarate oxidase LhgO [Pseudidiomarina planktonica]|uniref:L-2-hydroxyglutarate oxidase LhgO n=1 Tax=Pseudidiomarina planktonica TaxID=1323738 RepID=A0A1Y6ENP9_9GAMM|nr:FAD-dependent oxidoreductase [Pseudidiomarina planktonica]RUO65919.1 FAD-dependent oxidoreductase [Pseudidiomarina planktonica]SMQ61803.1 L-2-hydroxyglutarate oxidase LhgO [Pseudidiomarina planktonica]
MSKIKSTHFFDAVVIGGGFYGASIAAYLVEVIGLKKVAIIEKEKALMQRASYNNQARVHNGYHYPRSYTTAYRSRTNLPKFLNKWGFSVKTDFKKLYAIATRNSKVTPKQFERFCNEIGAPIKIADSSDRKQFNSKLIEEVFEVEEFAFDSSQLRQFAEKELKDLNVNVMLDTSCTQIINDGFNIYKCIVESAGQKNTGNGHAIWTSKIFNCTYSGLNQIKGEFEGVKTRVKHELTEMALIVPPDGFSDIGITVMDGPFFSTMPFPARQLHSMSHVRYTPHTSWEDDADINPYQRLERFRPQSRFDRMRRDIMRYIPSFCDAKYVDSLLELKTVLVKNEVDDGRPILFEKDAKLPGVYSILGGKIDNIFDIIEKLDSELRD